MPRRRNLWVTDTLSWAPEARLAQPANPMWDSAASAFPVRSQLPFEAVCPLRLNATPSERGLRPSDAATGGTRHVDGETPNFWPAAIRSKRLTLKGLLFNELAASANL